MSRKASDYTWVMDDDGKRTRVMRGAEHVRLQLPRKNASYTTVLGDRCVELYGQGNTIDKCAELLSKECKYKITGPEITKWMTTRPLFKTKMKAIRETRAMYAEDKVIDALETVRGESSEEVAAQRLKVDGYKWIAETNNPEVYGKKTKITGDPNAPISFIVDTGIRRDPLPDTEKPKLEDKGE